VIFGSDVLIGTTPTITASLAESPPGPSTGTFRVLRGRSWDDSPFAL